MINANQIRDNPLKAPIGEILIELREQSPTMMRAHKIRRLLFAAKMAAIGELAARDGKSGSAAFQQCQNILDEVGEKLTPGWFQKKVDQEITEILDARRRCNDFRRDGEHEFTALPRWLQFIVLTEFSGSKNMWANDALKRVMG